MGHSDPRVVQAVSAQMTKGTHLSAASRLEIMWAQLVNKLVPCAEKVRFLNSGTEAVMMSFRMARAYTGKQKIIKFQDGFHGWYDQAVVGTASDNANSGITDGARNSMIVVPLNDIDAFEDWFINWYENTTRFDAHHYAEVWKRIFGRRFSEITLGVIGIGKIGSHVIRLTKPFGTPRLLVNDIDSSYQTNLDFKLEWVSKEKIYKEFRKSLHTNG